MRKKILSLFILGVISVSIFIPATNRYASQLESISENLIEVSDNVVSEKENKGSMAKGVSIIDEEEIEKFAKEHNIDLFVNGEKIKRIETEISPIQN